MLLLLSGLSLIEEVTVIKFGSPFPLLESVNSSPVSAFGHTHRYAANKETDRRSRGHRGAHPKGTLVRAI